MLKSAADFFSCKLSAFTTDKSSESSLLSEIDRIVVLLDPAEQQQWNQDIQSLSLPFCTSQVAKLRFTSLSRKLGSFLLKELG